MDEREAMLHRAFVEKRAGCIVITSRRERLQIQSAEYGVERGWLAKTVDTEDEQSTAWVYRLTPKGRTYFFGTEATHGR